MFLNSGMEFGNSEQGGRMGQHTLHNTQCPIQPEQNYIYDFTITGQRGTLLWHAHILWLRATVHGSIVSLPKMGVPYSFPKPEKEAVIILGE